VHRALAGRQRIRMLRFQRETASCAVVE
jgi:hypothetical protein